MIPTINKLDVLGNLKIKPQPNKTYKMNIEEETIIGDVDELEAIQQAVYKILNTERYKHIIYSWGYGVELNDLYGKPLPYVYAELPRRIRDAIMYDDRIQDVIDFDLSNNKNDVFCNFKVVTRAGVLELEKGVTIA